MMSRVEIQTKAKVVGVIKPSSNKKELIRQIQTAEGFTACFQTKNQCEILQCCWREDCLKTQ